MTHARVTLTWGDGEHDFDLGPIKHLLELEEKCGVGVGAILQRMALGQWTVNDVREVLRLGLIGAGAKPTQAFVTLKRYCDDRPLAESIPAAKAVLLAAIVGVPGDDVGKAEPERETPTEAATASPVPSSMASALQ